MLSETQQITTPSLKLLSTLKEAGLGKKRIVFPNKNAEFLKLKAVLETEYPQLKLQDGAFELMRAEGGGYSRPLCLIPIPSCGYSVPYLKDMVGANTTIYIRPIKSSLSLEKSAMSVNPNSPLTECTTCKEQVSIFSLREHSKNCQNDSIVTITDDLDDDEIGGVSDGSVKENTSVSIPNPSSASQQDFVPHASLYVPSTSKSQPELDIYSPNLPSTSAQCWLSNLKHAFPDEDDKRMEEVASVAILVDEAALYVA